MFFHNPIPLLGTQNVCAFLPTLSVLEFLSGFWLVFFLPQHLAKIFIVDIWSFKSSKEDQPELTETSEWMPIPNLNGIANPLQIKLISYSVVLVCFQLAGLVLPGLHRALDLSSSHFGAVHYTLLLGHCCACTALPRQPAGGNLVKHPGAFRYYSLFKIGISEVHSSASKHESRTFPSFLVSLFEMKNHDPWEEKNLEVMFCVIDACAGEHLEIQSVKAKLAFSKGLGTIPSKWPWDEKFRPLRCAS